jgi:hypothetical protein
MAAEAEVAALVVPISAETGKFIEDLKKAEEASIEFRNTVLETIGEGITKVIEASFETFEEMSGAIIKVTRAGERLGIPVQELSALKFAAMDSGVGFDSLVGSITKFERNLSEAVNHTDQVNAGLERLGDGGNQAAKALQQLGLNAVGLKGKGVTEQFQILSKELLKVKDHADRMAIAMRLFGKSGTNMLQILDQGPEKIAEMEEEAKKLGVTFTDAQGKAVIGAQAAVEKFRAVIDGVKQQFTIAVAPYIEKIGTMLTDMAAKTVQYLAPALIKVVELAGFLVSKLVEGISSVFGKLEALGKWLGIIGDDGEHASEGVGKLSEEAKKIQEGKIFGHFDANKLMDDFDKVGKHAAIALAGKSAGLSDEEIGRQQQVADLKEKLAAQGMELNNDELERLDLLSKQASEIEKQIKAREEAEKAAKEAAKEQEKLMKEQQKQQEKMEKEAAKALEDKQKDLAQKAHQFLEGTLSPVAKLKEQMDEVAKLNLAGALTTSEAGKIQNQLVGQFAQANAVKPTAGAAIRFGSAEAEYARTRPEVSTEKAVWKMVDQNTESIRTEQEILESLQDLPNLFQVVSFN